MISIYKQKKTHGLLTVGFLFFSNYDIMKASEKSVKIVSIRFTKKTPRWLDLGVSYILENILRK